MFIDSSICVANNSRNIEHSLFLVEVCLLLGNGPAGGSVKRRVQNGVNKVILDEFPHSADCTGSISSSPALILNSCISESPRSVRKLTINYGILTEVFLLLR